VGSDQDHPDAETLRLSLKVSRPLKCVLECVHVDQHDRLRTLCGYSQGSDPKHRCPPS
jgi:hypothetical protein